MSMNEKYSLDTLFSKPSKNNFPFQFNEKVANVFPDMIKRSVPGYENILEMISLFAKRFVQPHSRCYDLGTAIGTGAYAMQKSIVAPDCVIYAIDNSSAMLEKCHSSLLEENQITTPIEYMLMDIADITIENASMVVLNFTMQFLPREKRQCIMNKIVNGLRPSGICILSEKISFDHEKDTLFQNFHDDFKRNKGYSDLEISQKRQSLEDVLIPNTYNEIMQMFSQSGFGKWYMWFQQFHFCSFFAQK